MKGYENVDFHRYDRNPIPDSIAEIEKEIAHLKELDKDDFLAPIEHQLILDRVLACQDKIADIRKAKIKITPVLRTSTIGDKKRNKDKPQYSLTESKLLL